MADQARALFEAVKEKFSHLVIGLADLKWEDLPPAVVEYLQRIPKMTALQLVCLLVAVIPSLIATPALFAMGFGGAGPMAGFLSTAFQSMFGCTAPFSVLQSAAMGGYGVAIVNGYIQACSFAVAGITNMMQWDMKAKM